MADACGCLDAADTAIHGESPSSIVFLFFIVVSMDVLVYLSAGVDSYSCGRLALGGDELYTPQRSLLWTDVAVICAALNT